jgi:hypothetical protein
LSSLSQVAWPRVRRLVIDQHMSKAVADTDIIETALDGLPHLEVLEVANCLDDDSVTALVRCVVDLPLRSLKLDRLSEAAARILIDAGRSFELVTRRESVSAATRDKLHKILRWRSDSNFRTANHATARPQHAPQNFASLTPITTIADDGMDEVEWAGSGVPVQDHPMEANGGTACGACHGTNTHVIWARYGYRETRSWGPSNFVTYDLICRDCYQFTVYDTPH